MKYLYQYIFGCQPHYVVAQSFADAEAAVKVERGDYVAIERIDCLGPYVLLSPNVLDDLANE